jgi:plastocyanin
LDSDSVGSYNNFDIYLPMPIIVEDDEKAYIRLKDFQMLNSCYNISSDLQNNTFTIQHTTRTYTRTPIAGSVEYFTDTNLFQTAGGNIYKPILNSVNDGVAHTETLTQNAGNFTIKLYDSTIITSGTITPANSKFMNIFNATTSTAFMTFNATDYLVYYNATTPTESRFVSSCEVVLENYALTSTAPTTTVYVGIQVWGSVDGITWYELLLVGSNVITWATNEWATAIQKSMTFTFSTIGAYQYHKVSFLPVGFTTTADLKTKIKFKKILLLRNSAYTETIADSTITYNKTIEDGFYSITNLNTLLNYYLSLHISSNLSFTNYIQSKSFTTAQNKQVLGWGSAQPYYYYKETDKADESYKVEIQFNSILRKMLGWISPTSIGTIILLRINDYTTAPNYLNLINFKKILLTSSLKLTTKPYTFLNKTYTKASGVGDIFAWFNKDLAPFQYINWTNQTDYKIEIDDKLITKINFKIVNEYAQVMNDVPACNFHLQLIKIKY